MVREAKAGVDVVVDVVDAMALVESQKAIIVCLANGLHRASTTLPFSLIVLSHL